MTVITRVAYCEECEKERSPRTNQGFLARGDSGWKVLLALKNGMSGFTPHLFSLIGHDKIYAFFQVVCCMEGCGSYYKEKGKNTFLTLKKERWSDMRAMKLTDWNALCCFTDTGYQV